MTDLIFMVRFACTFIIIKYIRDQYRAIGFFPMNVHKYKFARKCVRWRKIWGKEPVFTRKMCYIWGKEWKERKRSAYRLTLLLGKKHELLGAASKTQGGIADGAAAAMSHATSRRSCASTKNRFRGELQGFP